MIDTHKIDVLYIHPSGIGISDYNIPMGLIGLMNSIDCAKMGKMYFEVTDNLIAHTKIVALDCHWYFPLSTIGRLSNELKRINPSIVIIVGGHTATVFAEMIVKRFKVDYVIKGDAEMPFSLLVNELLEGRDGCLVPNIVSKRFSTPQSYHLSVIDYSKYDYINVDWFPRFKERMAVVHKLMPFGYDECLGVYPFIPVYKGCKYNCDFCYAKQDLQKKLYRRALVSRRPESIIKDLQICSNNKDINQVHFIADFVNMLGEEYTNKIFSQRYDINLYYEFEHFNSPPISTLEKMIDCFNRCYFTFIFAEPFHRDPKQRFLYLREVINYFKSSKKEVKVRIYNGNSTEFMKYYTELKQGYEDLDFGNCKPWFTPVPAIYKNNNDSKVSRYFSFWKKKAEKISSLAFIAKSPNDDDSRLHLLLGNYLVAAKKYNKAINNFNLALRLSPFNISIHLGLAKAYFNLKRYKETIKEATKVIELDTKVTEAYLLRGYCYEKIKQFKKAIRELKKAEKINSEEPQISFALFRCYRNTGKIKHAIKEFKQGVLKLKRIPQIATLS